ncbi:MAG: alpha/beta fold hydrolase [Solirubrobacterales bacterium]
MNPNPGTRPAWVDDSLFPFESHFAEIDGNVVHYVDEGSGPTLLLLHGNPTWSFLYRKMIAGLRDRFRCVAVDYPGFGLSAASPGYGYTAAEHALVIERLVEHLDLTDITVAVQDWAGPIGVAAASRNAERYRALIIGNTWAWPKNELATRAFSFALGGPVGRQLIERFNLFARRIVPAGYRRHSLTDAELEHYTRPFPDAAARVPTHVFPKQIMDAMPLLRETEAGLNTLSDLPALILWATGDIAFGAGERKRWESELPNHTTHLLEGAGHYWQDDAGEEAAREIKRWWPEGAEPGDGAAA